MTHDQQTWINTLKSLCERNEVVEIMRLDNEEDEGAAARDQAVGLSNRPVFRMRLLNVDGRGEIIVQRAGGIDPDMDPAKAELVEVLAVRDRHRWRGICPVGGAMLYQLNSTTKVRAINIRPAIDIQSAQRRRMFRVDMLSRPIDIALLRSTTRDLDKPPPTHGDLPARLVNISGGGVGLVVQMSNELLHDLKKRARYRCVLYLTGEDEPIDVDGRFIHLHTTVDGSAYLGIEFEFAGRLERDCTEDRIVRFITMLQREQLRRARRA